MNRIGYFLLTIAAALYLFANGILGISNRSGEFSGMVRAIFGGGDFSNILIIVLSVCGIAAGIFLILALLRIDVPINDIILIVFIVLWVIFIVIMDIIQPLRGRTAFLPYLIGLASHLMILGTLVISVRRFGN